jgi:hypothetical protein
MANNAGGNQNTAAGSSGLFTNSAGSNNAASGFKALFNNTACNNTAEGVGAPFHNTGGVNNTAAGFGALGGCERQPKALRLAPCKLPAVSLSLCHRRACLKSPSLPSLCPGHERKLQVHPTRHPHGRE